jgi:hypothetical protein
MYRRTKVTRVSSMIMMNTSIVLKEITENGWKLTLFIVKHKHPYSVLMNFGDSEDFAGMK